VFLINGLEPFGLIRRLNGLIIVQHMKFFSVGEATSNSHTDELSFEWRTGSVKSSWISDLSTWKRERELEALMHLLDIASFTWNVKTEVDRVHLVHLEQFSESFRYVNLMTRVCLDHLLRFESWQLFSAFYMSGHNLINQMTGAAVNLHLFGD
jgi:hypothetical protein